MGMRNVTVGAVYNEKIGLSKQTVAGEKIELKCGESSITLEKSGKIVIRGTAIEMVGDDDVMVQGKLIRLN